MKRKINIHIAVCVDGYPFPIELPCPDQFGMLISAGGQGPQNGQPRGEMSLISHHHSIPRIAILSLLFSCIFRVHCR